LNIIEIQKMSMFIKRIKKIFKAFDLFGSNVSLRYKEESSHKTTAGGIVSIFIMVILFLTFTKMVIETLTLNNYTLKTSIEKNQTPVQSFVSLNPDSQESQMMFGV